jgi:glutamyl-tRNA(Gln) amidotransferase subunit D
MHESESDDACALHRGTRVRKNHTSRRDAFETVGAKPIGRVEWETDEVSFRRPVAARGATEPALDAELDTDVEHLKFVPGTGPDRLDIAAGASGLVIEGTGLGHVHTDWIDRIEALVADGTTVVMTSQCLEGRVCDRVYDTGRDLLDAGVVEAGDTLPETAYVKLMWALANVESVAETMRKPIEGELQERSVPWT